MNLSRLMILGLLAERGPMHGHQIRRTAELTNAEVWGGITGGALYAELRRLDTDGLIVAVRAEQVGRRPARTVYEITDDGKLELVVQRDAALEEAVRREGAAAHAAQLARDGADIGSAASFEHGRLANRHPPVLQTFNVRGERIDALLPALGSHVVQEEEGHTGEVASDLALVRPELLDHLTIPVVGAHAQTPFSTLAPEWSGRGQDSAGAWAPGRRRLSRAP